MPAGVALIVDTIDHMRNTAAGAWDSSRRYWAPAGVAVTMDAVDHIPVG